MPKIDWANISKADVGELKGILLSLVKLLENFDSTVVKLGFESPTSIDYTSVSFSIYVAKFDGLLVLGQKLEDEYERKINQFTGAIK